jgi:hypothetical protein
MAWGPFHLGRWDLPINVLGIIYAVWISIFLPFPPTQPVNWVNNELCGPVLGAVLVFGAFDWFVIGRRHFHGSTVKVAKGKKCAFPTTLSLPFFLLRSSPSCTRPLVPQAALSSTYTLPGPPGPHRTDTSEVSVAARRLILIRSTPRQHYLVDNRPYSTG